MMGVVSFGVSMYGYECPACGWQALPLRDSRLDAINAGILHGLQHVLKPTASGVRGRRAAERGAADGGGRGG